MYRVCELIVVALLISFLSFTFPNQYQNKDSHCPESICISIKPIKRSIHPGEKVMIEVRISNETKDPNDFYFVYWLLKPGENLLFNVTKNNGAIEKKPKPRPTYASFGKCGFIPVGENTYFGKIIDLSEYYDFRKGKYIISMTFTSKEREKLFIVAEQEKNPMDEESKRYFWSGSIKSNEIEIVVK